MCKRFSQRRRLCFVRALRRLIRQGKELRLGRRTTFEEEEGEGRHRSKGFKRVVVILCLGQLRPLGKGSNHVGQEDQLLITIDSECQLSRHITSKTSCLRATWLQWRGKLEHLGSVLW